MMLIPNLPKNGNVQDDLKAAGIQSICISVGGFMEIVAFIHPATGKLEAMAWYDNSSNYSSDTIAKAVIEHIEGA